MDRNDVIRKILSHEGGLNENEPQSAGGVSYAGITQKTYQAYLDRIQERVDSPAPVNVRGLADRQDVIYTFYDLYLEDNDVWLLPVFLQYIYADFATNAGSAAAKIIQGMVGVKADGVIGSGTRRAIEAWKARVEIDIEANPDIDNDLIMQFHDAKLAHYQQLVDKNPDKFGKWHGGWKRRAMEVLGELQPYFGNSEKPPRVPEIEYVEERSPQQQRESVSTEIETSVNETRDKVSDVAQAIGNFEQGVNEGFDKLSSKIDKLDKRLRQIEEYLEQFSRFNEEV